MDESVRLEIAQVLESLAEQKRWNPEMWKYCHDLVDVNSHGDELLEYLYDDLIHYTATPLFRSEPPPGHIQSFAREFRDFASAIRSHMSLAEFKKNYEW